ncbi:MAG: toll/interleukin-1 receptor domain-containing protein [Chitinophagaceae bacterium]|nr:MAG: toll/interleukin-1 receptor domain-containing protein [Chitinophagaceae bacterium]
MKAIERIELLEKIGSELQSRMTYGDIDIFLSAHGISTNHVKGTVNSKRIYAKEALSETSEEKMLEIANELGVHHSFTTKTIGEATFWKSGYFKLFLSHLSSFKVQTAHLQSVLKKYAISGFVAHEDIEPSKEWQNEIETALHTMDALAAILMEGFRESNWCDQEVGFAVGKDVLIIPVRKGLDPYGFIGKYQGIQALNKTVGEVAEQIFSTIVKSPKTRGKILTSLVNAISQSTDVAEAIEKIKILNTVENPPVEIIDSLQKNVVENSVLMGSEKFIKEINSMLANFGVSAIGKLSQSKEKQWDDIPF